MSYLIGITENDYREYRKNFSKVEYSFARRGEVFPVPMKQIREVLDILECWVFAKEWFLLALNLKIRYNQAKLNQRRVKWTNIREQEQNKI